MANRRSMNDALTLNPEKLAFIHGGAKAMDEASKEQPVPAKAHEAPAPLAQTTQLESEPPSVPTVRRGRKPKITSQAFEPSRDSNDLSSFEEFPAIWVPLTTRLSPSTAEALRRASLELRIQRRRPHTQQEIVEAAVCHWLKTHGFGKAA